MTYEISELRLAGGATLGIGPLPPSESLRDLEDWAPDAVLSMTTAGEMAGLDFAGHFGARWHHLAISDFGTPRAEIQAQWHGLSPKLHEILDGGGRIFAHCYGGKGRSGMMLLRLMVERGAVPENALAELRAIRPGAVETRAQLNWARDTGRLERSARGSH